MSDLKDSGGNVVVPMNSDKRLKVKLCRGGTWYEFPPVPKHKYSWAGLKFWLAVKRWNTGTRYIQLSRWIKSKWQTF